MCQDRKQRVSAPLLPFPLHTANCTWVNSIRGRVLQGWVRILIQIPEFAALAGIKLRSSEFTPPSPPPSSAQTRSSTALVTVWPCHNYSPDPARLSRAFWLENLPCFTFSLGSFSAEKSDFRSASKAEQWNSGPCNSNSNQNQNRNRHRHRHPNGNRYGNSSESCPVNETHTHTVEVARLTGSAQIDIQIRTVEGKLTWWHFANYTYK